jgi:hypothetical protein
MQVKHGVVTGVLDADGELSDEAAHHIYDAIQTKAAILQYIEPIAQVLAEAGRASAEAIGDDPCYSLDRWLGVIRERALAVMLADQVERRQAADPFKHGTVGHDGRNPLRELIEKSDSCP